MDAIQQVNPHFDDDTLYILPTFLRVEEELASILDRSECGVIFGRKISTFPQLIKRIYEEVPTSKTLLSSPAQLVLVERILGTLYRGNNDGYFAPLINSKSLSKTLLNIIITLKSNNINHDEFSDLVNRSESEHKKKLGEVASVYHHYQMRLSGSGLADMSDVNWAVKDFVADQSNEISLLKGVHNLVVEDIYDFTPVQFDLIVALAHRIAHTTVSLPYDHDRSDIFGFVERTIKWFEGLWELNRDINLDFKFQRGSPQAVVSKIAERYLKQDNQSTHEPFRINNEVVLIESAGIYREAEAIGKEIRKLLDAGVKPGTVGVLFQDLSRYSEMIEDVFHRFRIPLYFRRGRPLLSSNIAKTILSIFELLDTNFERDVFLKIMRSNYVDCWNGEHPLLCEKMELFILRAGIIDDRHNAWEDRLTRLVEYAKRKRSEEVGCEEVEASEVPTEYEMVKRLRDRVLWFKGEIEVFRENTTIEKFCDTLKRVVHVLGMQKAIMCCDDDDVVKRDCASLRKIEQILDAVAALAKRLSIQDEIVTYRYFRSLLLKFMEESFILAGREADHGVKVLNLYESRGLTFDYLFFGGCAEDSTPGKGWEDPLFSDEDKAQFNHTAGKKVFLLKEEEREEEPLLFYLGLSCARKRLYLSYSQVDAQGRTLLPSFYLSELRRLLGTAADTILQPDPGLVIPHFGDCCAEEEIVNRMTLSLWIPWGEETDRVEGMRDDQEVLTPGLFNQLIVQDRFRHAFEKIFYCADIEKRREGFLLEEDVTRRKHRGNVWTGMIRQKAILKELGDFFESGEGRLWSPTNFERYSGCPFRFFLERVLHVYSLEIPEEEIEKVDEGTLIHTVLERFFAARKRDNLLPLSGSKEEKHFIQAIADAVYEEWETEGRIGNRALWEIRKGKTASLWDRFIEEEGQFKEDGLMPTYFEFLIGDSSEDEQEAAMPALLFNDVNQSEIAVRGKVDRIDIGEGKVRIIDYKNSRSEVYYRNLLKNENIGTVNFQIPVYLAAVREHLSKRYRVNSMEATYYLFRKAKRAKPYVIGGEDPFFEKDLLIRKALNEQGKENIFNRMAAIVGEAKSGNFSISPQDCSFCGYNHVCRFVAVEIKEAEAGD